MNCVFELSLGHQGQAKAVPPAFREVIARAVQKDSPLWLADDK